MDLAARFLPFLAVAIVLVVVPGPDFAVVTRNVLRGGSRAGCTTSLGVATGMLVWTLLTVIGLESLLRMSTTAFAFVRLAGAGYLIYLGAKALFAAVRPSAERSEPHTQALNDSNLPARKSGMTQITGNGAEERHSRGLAYRQGLLCNLLNPKAAAIFTSLIPQFVVSGGSADLQLAVFGLTFVVLVTLWLSLYSVIAGRVGRVVRGLWLRRTVEGLTGTALLGFGVKLATAGR